MSQWTHAVGCIRVDGSPQAFGSRIEAVREVLGKVVTFDDLCKQEGPEDAILTTLPMGSEGSMRYHIIEYDKGLCWLSIPVWGDLRNFDDADAIIKWFKGVCEKLCTPNRANGLIVVRDAVIRVVTEGSDPVVFSWGVGDDSELNEKQPVDGRCCDCGYEGHEETECPKREDKTHCEHWWDGKAS